jgi:WhiB family redox-sensing transcriptional regulator
VHELNAAVSNPTTQSVRETASVPAPQSIPAPGSLAAADDVHVLFPARTPAPVLGFELAYTGEDEELAWQEQALCAQTDPEAFFPEKGGSTRDAKKICTVCPVRAECLEYALAHDERFGIWGGLSERERRRLKKQAG